MKALVWWIALLLPACACAADDCPAVAVRYHGASVQTDNRQLQRFMMVSAYHLEPYSEAYLNNVLADLGRHGIAGVVYGSLGEISAYLHAQGSNEDEIGLNRHIFDLARRYGAKIWLQERVYGNQLRVGAAPPRNYTADEILGDAQVRRAFQDRLRAEVQAYNDYFTDSCRVVMFEEAGIYHSAQGGGAFWSSETDRPARADDRHDRMFAQRMSGLFAVGKHEIKALNPHCEVGMHLGHSMFNNAPVLRETFDEMQRSNSRPDFIYYDLYLKAQPDFARYAAKLSERASLIIKDLRLPSFHMAQLHTMNNFQHGLGGTPSQGELDRMVQLDLQLGFSGIGFYGKNGAATAVFENGPLAPNARGQATVYESSRDRWDYGVLKLVELGGADFASLFDLVIRPAGEGEEMVYARNVKTQQWDLLGELSAAGPDLNSPKSLVVLRELDAGTYLGDQHRLDLRFAAADGSSGMSSAALWLVPSMPSGAFRGSWTLAEEVDASGTLAGARGRASVKIDGTDGRATLCLQ
jgi:hypothetical protein